MPYWTRKELQHLRELWPKAKSPADLQSLSGILGRSMEAVAMKAKRMGLSVPNQEKHFAKNSEKKNSFSATTTTPAPKLEPVKREELPSANEMMGLLVAAIHRLQAPDVSAAETKKLRLLIMGAKSYINLEAGVVLRLRHMESSMLAEWRHVAATWQTQIERASTEEEKARFKVLLQDAQEHIKSFVELGVPEPKELREETFR